MIEVLPQSHENLLVFKTTSKLTHEDYQETLIPKLNQVISEYGKAKVLFDFGEHFPGMELEAVWDDTKFGITHRDDFLKAAIVGDDNWIKWGSKLSSALVTCQLRTYNSNQFDEALTWIEKDDVVIYKEYPEDSILEVDIDGKISAEEYHELAQKCLDFMEEKGKIKVIKIIRNYGGLDLEILKEKLILKLFSHVGDITHTALVTDEQWITNLSKFVTPLYKCKTKTFSLEQIDEARAWLKSSD